MNHPTQHRIVQDATLRPYHPSDLRSIVSLDRLCFAEQFRFTSRYMRRYAEAAKAISLVAEGQISAEILGFVIVHLEHATRDTAAYVVTLDVRPCYSRSGLGTKLLTSAELLAATAGAALMSLNVYTGNLGAINFYEANGYSQSEQIRNFYKTGQNAFLYVKDLRVSAL